VVLRIEVGAVPPISNNMMAIPVVILIVNLFVSIFDIEFLNRKEVLIAFHLVYLYTIWSLDGNLKNISELPYLPMTTIAILAVLAILAGATLLITGFTVMSSLVAQMADNETMGNLTVGNMTGGNVTGGNTTGSISAAT
jgi:hypothetical protein